jgi:hypothetical protein
VRRDLGVNQSRQTAGSFSCPAWAGNSADFPGNAGLQPGSGSHAGAWRSQGQPGENRKLNGPGQTALDEVMPRSENAGEKICKKGLDNSGNIEGNSNGLLAPPRRWRPPQPPPPAAPLCARLLRAAQSAAAASPERPGARRSTALHGAGWCWTGAAGWGRGARREALE